jgi:hypothetical protein
MWKLIFAIRRLSIIVACTALPVMAIAEASSDEEAVDAAMATLDEFMLAFNARDMDAWSATLNYPHVRFASGSVTVYATRADFSSRLPFQSLAEIGWDHSHWLSRTPILASPEKVHLSTVFQRYNADNELIGTYQSLYIVTKVDGQWGIQARSSMAP